MSSFARAEQQWLSPPEPSFREEQLAEYASDIEESGARISAMASNLGCTASVKDIRKEVYDLLDLLEEYERIQNDNGYYD